MTATTVGDKLPLLFELGGTPTILVIKCRKIGDDITQCICPSTQQSSHFYHAIDHDLKQSPGVTEVLQLSACRNYDAQARWVKLLFKIYSCAPLKCYSPSYREVCSLSNIFIPQQTDVPSRNSNKLHNPSINNNAQANPHGHQSNFVPRNFLSRSWDRCVLTIGQTKAWTAIWKNILTKSIVPMLERTGELCIRAWCGLLGNLSIGWLLLKTWMDKGLWSTFSLKQKIVS